MGGVEWQEATLTHCFFIDIKNKVEKNAKDGEADKGHEQVRVIEETKIVMEEPIMQENEQGMEDAEPVPVSEVPMPIREDPMPVREDPMPIREDPMPLREELEAAMDKAQENQGKGFASQGPSNMEPLSDEAIILAKINKENKEELQVLIRSVPLHAKILLLGRSGEDCIFTLDR
ncbi:hypothetical protein L7F22_030021 [Adiantum nelumboides]|nr:hypothetical protein [Adiantum nelumboides]